MSNGCGSATSKIITLSVSSRPTITTQPKSQTLYLGQPDTFSVVATGVPQPTYQWKKNGATITGATNALCIISSPGISDSGKYTVTVTNTAGTVISDTAKFYAVVKGVAAGNSHSLILKTDGTLWACGDNTFGQLGDGTTTKRSTPKFIMDHVQNMAAGWWHSLILKTDGTLWACGDNSYGQLGDGTNTQHLIPVQITNISNIQRVVVGAYHSLILKSDGTLYACGDNSNGQLGDGTTTNRSTPVQVSTINNVLSIAAGMYHSLILRAMGHSLALWKQRIRRAWGQHNNGSIGT